MLQSLKPMRIVSTEPGAELGKASPDLAATSLAASWNTRMHSLTLSFMSVDKATGWLTSAGAVAAGLIVSIATATVLVLECLACGNRGHRIPITLQLALLGRSSKKTDQKKPRGSSERDGPSSANAGEDGDQGQRDANTGAGTGHGDAGAMDAAGEGIADDRDSDSTDEFDCPSGCPSRACSSPRDDDRGVRVCPEEQGDHCVDRCPAPMNSSCGGDKSIDHSPTAAAASRGLLLDRSCTPP